MILSITMIKQYTVEYIVERMNRVESNHIQLVLEDKNRPSFRNYLKDLLGDVINIPEGEKKRALSINFEYGDLLFHIGVKRDLEALKIVRDEVGLVYCPAAPKSLIETIVESEEYNIDFKKKNEMISVLADCGWRFPADRNLTFTEAQRAKKYLETYEVSEENISKTLSK